MYKCECGKEFEKQRSLNSHARFCKMYIKKIKKPSIYKIDDNLYKCECGKIFKSPASLGGHFNQCEIHNPKNKLKDNLKGSRGWCKGTTYEEYLGKDKAEKYKKKLSNLAKKRFKENGISLETRNKLSKSRVSYLENHKGIPWYSVNNGDKEIKVQGKWEKLVALWLNANNIKWERKLIRYDKIRRYTPDFYLPDQDWYIEVKGWFRDSDILKMDKVIKEHNIVIKILSKNEIKNLSNLTIFDLINYK